MRNVIFAINITLDGCCDHTKMIADEEVHGYFTRFMREEVDLLVFGRKTYELMVPFWPDVAKNRSETKAMNEFAQVFDSINRMVVSRSLETADTKTRIVRENLPGEIRNLKQQPGESILVGGVNVPSQLMELGLVDEYRFIVQPILAGEGTRLLQGVNLHERFKLKLVESKIFKSGCVAVRYLKQ